ncbi:OmpW/AlkL family protein [Halopseudomonas pelagia]|uniref:OmpW/AlkL family protein n=1 Tax=Halopseudomonas pelagia TaxID=553151 RepID=UPI00039BE320|nr:OmpW family outer membrane protein [Halopseudomonas pelagia]|tara:strand:+ start:2711 stop:3406 length:696 start_codon:yes stop_codon:yes gene_type:complete
MSRSTIQLAAGLLLIPALLATSVAHAHQAGDIIVRAGAITVDPREDSGAIQHATLGSVAGSKATLDSDTQLGLNLMYMLSPQIGVELLAASPFSHSVGVKGMPGGFSGLNGKLGDIKHLPPTLSAVWYPVTSESVFQPYFGAGINYTWFFDESVSSEAKDKGFQGLSLDNSWGLALQAGADMMLTDKLMLNAQVRYIDISTTGHTKLGGEKVKVNVDVDPMVYMVGLGYKF